MNEGSYSEIDDKIKSLKEVSFFAKCLHFTLLMFSAGYPCSRVNTKVSHGR